MVRCGFRSDRGSCSDEKQQQRSRKMKMRLRKRDRECREGQTRRGGPRGNTTEDPSEMLSKRDPQTPRPMNVEGGEDDAGFVVQARARQATSPSLQANQSSPSVTLSAKSTRLILGLDAVALLLSVPCRQESRC